MAKILPYATVQKTGSTTEIPAYATEGIGLAGPYFMGSTSEISFMFCTEIPNECGSRMCPGDVYSKDREGKSYEKLFSLWGGPFLGVQLSPAGRYLAFNGGYSHGGIIGGRYPEVWDLKTKEQLPTPAFYRGDDKSWFSLIAMEWLGPDQLKIDFEEMRMPGPNEGDYGVRISTKTEILSF